MPAPRPEFPAPECRGNGGSKAWFEWAQMLQVNVKSVKYYEPIKINPNGASTVPDADGWIRIVDDCTSPPNLSAVLQLNSLSFISGNSSTTAWQSNGSTKPIAYVSGFLPRIEAQFDISGVLSYIGCTGDVYVKADWGGAIQVPITKLNNNYSTGPVKLDASTYFTFFQPGHVRFANNMTLNWKYAFQENAPEEEWKSAGSSVNNFYVTHDVPGIPYGTNQKNTFFKTLVRNSCRDANGHSDLSAISALIFNDYASDKKVESQCFGLDIEYWGNYSSSTLFNTVRSQWQMLFWADGRCGEWQELFSDMLALHGVVTEHGGGWNSTSSSGILVTPYNTVPGYATGYLPAAYQQEIFNTIEKYFNTPGSGGQLFDPINPYDFSNRVAVYRSPNFQPESYLFVKNWNFGDENKLYLVAPVGTVISTPGAFPYNEIEGADESGAAAQSNGDPRSDFSNHAILRYEGNYYDPSYGTGPFYSQEEWTQNSLSGYGAEIRYVDDQGVAHDILWLHKKAENQNFTQFTDN